MMVDLDPIVKMLVDIRCDSDATGTNNARHSCAIFHKKNKSNTHILSTGMNHDSYKHIINTGCSKCYNRNLSINDRGIHAEKMAMEKLYPRKNKKIINVSLIVIRISKKSTISSYTLNNSRPCANCVNDIYECSNRGYRITKIYYSNTLGNITCFKLRDLIVQPQRLSKYYRATNIPIKLQKKYQFYNKEDEKCQLNLNKLY